MIYELHPRCRLIIGKFKDGKFQYVEFNFLYKTISTGYLIGNRDMMRGVNEGDINAIASYLQRYTIEKDKRIKPLLKEIMVDYLTS